MLVGLLGGAVRNVEFYRQLNKEVSGNNMQRHDLLVVKVVPVMVRKESRENHGPVKDLCRNTGESRAGVLKY